jgi:precorrin-4/cobalt-precorrin-4 C11-methyltransferase
VVSRASWPDEKAVEGTLGDIEAKVTKAGIRKTALIMVGRALRRAGGTSRLYDKAFTHGYRKATS